MRAIVLMTGLALLSGPAAAVPGDLITIQAFVNESGPLAEVSFAVVSLLDTGRPVYAPAAVRLTKSSDGTVIQILDPTLFGRTVKIPICIGGTFDWFTGIQLRDGRVWANGYAVTPLSGRLQ